MLASFQRPAVEVEFPHTPFYAYNEVLAPFVDAPSRTASVLSAAESLSRYLSAGAVTRSVQLSETWRTKLRDAYYLRSAASDRLKTISGANEPVHVGEFIFLDFQDL